MAFNEEESTINIIYSVISVTSPVLGVVLGGVISNKLGGYKSDKVVY